jgi:hypothetical protein
MSQDDVPWLHFLIPIEKQQQQSLNVTEHLPWERA